MLRRNKTSASVRHICCLMLFMLAAHPAWADLSSYSQDFEGLDMSSTSALADDGWLVFGNVYDTGSFVYSYGPFDAPNSAASGTDAFSAVATGEAGPNQGIQYINVFSDYQNPEHTNGSGFTVEANVFQEQIIGAPDLGSTFEFLFDYRAASAPFSPGGDASTFAFIKVIDPDTGFSLVTIEALETTSATEVWSEGNTLSITIDGLWENDLLQFGFLSNASNQDPTGIYYDNLEFRMVPEPAAASILFLGMLGLASWRRQLQG